MTTRAAAKRQQIRHRRTATRRAGVQARRAAGFHPLAQGILRFAGAIPCRKVARGAQLLYFTSHHEFVAGLMAIVHPRIATIGRGDVSDDAARLLEITGPHGHRRAISALFDGEAHEYLPDYDALTPDGAEIVIEAGLVRKKAAPRRLAKLAAARDLARLSGGEVWVIDADLVPRAWVRNAVCLYLRSMDPADPKLVEAILAIWDLERVSIAKLIERFDAHPPEIVEAAAFAAAGRLFCQGRLEGRYDNVTLSLAMPLRARRVGAPPILPPGIITDLDELVRLANELGGPLEDDDDDDADEPAPRDESDYNALPEEQRAAVRRLEAAYEEYLTLDGVSAAEVARHHGIDERAFQRAVKRVPRGGLRALQPYAQARRPRGSYLDERLQKLILELYTSTERPTYEAIAAHPGVHRLSRELGRKRVPGICAIKGVIARAKQRDHGVRQKRAGKALLPLTMFGNSIPTNGQAGLVLEFDEEIVDVKALALDGSEVTIRLHLGALICIATRVIVSVVVSPKALDQWDYRRLLLRAILPKDEVRKRFRIKSNWPSFMPYIVRSDRGKIETARMVFQAAADLPFIIELAPVRDAHAKPFIESFFGAMKDLLEHRLKVTTKSSPYYRGSHDPDIEAVKGQIGVEKIELVIMRWVADSYHNRIHGGANEAPLVLFGDRVREFGLRRWLRSADDLCRELRRDAGFAKVTDHGIPFHGFWYGNGVLTQHGRRLRRLVVDDDVRAFDVFDRDGGHVARVVNEKLARWPRPISLWELQFVKKVIAKRKAATGDATQITDEEILAELEAPKVDVRAERRRRYQAERAAETARTTEADLLQLGRASAEQSAPGPARVPPSVEFGLADLDSDDLPGLDVEVEFDDTADAA